MQGGKVQSLRLVTSNVGLTETSPLHQHFTESISVFERLARASASPTRSDPEGSSRNETPWVAVNLSPRP
jgi:hypothetical protein